MRTMAMSKKVLETEKIIYEIFYLCPFSSNYNNTFK